MITNCITKHGCELRICNRFSKFRLKFSNIRLFHLTDSTYDLNKVVIENYD